MTLELASVTIDCENPQQLAVFWAGALDLKIAQDYGEFLVLAPSAGGPPTLGLQRVPEPRTEKNRIHVDLVASDRAEEVKRLVGLGAAEVAEHEVPGFGWTVLSDPEGNQFCVGDPGAH